MLVVWHSSVTVAEQTKIENIQKTSVKIILAENYIDYPASLEITGLQYLSTRQTLFCSEFAKRCIKNPLTQHMFPKNPEGDHNLWIPERYVVNAAYT